MRAVLVLERANQGALDTEVKAQEVACDPAFQRAAATSVPVLGALPLNDVKVDETTTPATRSLSSGLLAA